MLFYPNELYLLAYRLILREDEEHLINEEFNYSPWNSNLAISLLYSAKNLRGNVRSDDSHRLLHRLFIQLACRQRCNRQILLQLRELDVRISIDGKLNRTFRENRDE